MKNKSVLITGSSTGIGRACALYLDKKGYKVYAGIRKESDSESLKSESSELLTPIILDVTDIKSIENSYKFINDDSTHELFGIVNNAGIGISGVLEAISVNDVRNLMEVNVIGLMAVTKTFIPLVKSTKGRIINIGSTSSFFSSPGASAYSASKFAVRAISDSLRLELKHLGITVSLVAPGAVESEIWNKSKSYKEKVRQSVSPDILKDYSTIINFGDKLLDKIKPIPAIVVAKTVEHAITSKKPKRYYLVGSDCKAAVRASKLPKILLDSIILKHIQRLGKQGTK
jgi:short-subunit dehydrogenase